MHEGATARIMMRRLQRENGAVELIVALSLVAILGITALVVDIGNAKQTRRNFQTAADSGSLAGAQQLPSATTAQTFAADYAFDSANQARGSQTSSNCSASNPDVPIPGTTVCYQQSGGVGPMVYVTTPCSSATVCPPPADGSNPAAGNLINVKVCQTLNTSFARVLGINTTHVCNSATADNTSGPGNCVLCIMSTPSSGCTLELKGTADLDVTGIPPGPITVNATNSDAVCGNGNTNVDSPGGFFWAGCPSSCNEGWTTNPVHGPPTADPLRAVPVPSVSGTPKTCDDGQTCNPGVYSTITATHSTTTLNPGIYVVTGSIDMKQNGTLLGSGVMIYLACSNYPTPCSSSGEDGAGFSGNGGNVGLPNQPLSAPTSGTYSGLLIFADRNNTADLFGSNGNITYNMKGTIYALNASVELGGGAGTTLDSRFVVGQIHMHGNPMINEIYADQFQGLPTTGGVALVG